MTQPTPSAVAPDERALFEAAHPHYALNRNIADGHYCAWVQNVWEGWMARAALAAPAPSKPVGWAVYFARKGSLVEDMVVVGSLDRAEKEVDASLIRRVIPLFAGQPAPQSSDVARDADAARYQFLRRGFGDFGPDVDMHNAFVDGNEKMDAAIDAAIAQEAQ